MFDKIVANILTSYLGKYISNLNKDNVRVSIWRGNVVLNNLTLRQNALRSLELPVLIKEGVIGTLTVVIPWTRLNSESVQVEMSDVVIVVHPKKATAYNEAQEAQDAYENKQEQLIAFEATLLEEGKKRSRAISGGGEGITDEGVDDLNEAAEEAAKDKGLVERLRGTMLNNVRITVRNVQVTYEDVVTDPSRPIRMTLSLDSLSMQATNADWAPAFAPLTERIFFRVAKLSNLSLRIDGGGGDTYLAAPVDLTLRVQHQPIPYDPDVPRWAVDGTMSPLAIKVDRRQWDAIWRSARYVREFERFDMFRKFRPSVQVKGNAADWWRYAYRSVCHVLQEQRRRSRFSLQEYRETKKLRIDYAELHKRSLPGDWLLPLTETEKLRYIEIEKKLPLWMLTLMRRLAHSRHHLEGEQHDARVAFLKRREARERANAAAQAGSAGGWLGWWRGQERQQQDPVAVIEETPEEQAEAERLWGLIDTERWSEEQRRALRAEFGMPQEGEDDELVRAVSRATAATSAVTVVVGIIKVSVDLLGYDRVPFARMELVGAEVNYLSDSATWSYAMRVADYGMYDCQAESLLPEDASGSPTTKKKKTSERTILTTVHAGKAPEDTSGPFLGGSFATVPAAAAAVATTTAAGISVLYEKMNAAELGDEAPKYRCSAKLRPAVVNVKVPFLQRCVAFWGVSTSLVVAQAKSKAAAALAPEMALAMWYEKQQPCEYSLELQDWCVVIDDGASWCCFNFPLLALRNDVEGEIRVKEAVRRAMMSATTQTVAAAPEGGGSPPAPEGVAKHPRSSRLVGLFSESGWSKRWQLTLTRMSIDSFWDAGVNECRVVHEFDAKCLFESTIVDRHWATPRFAVSFGLPQPFRIDSDRCGLFTLLSGVSLITELINNASGRGTSYVLPSEDAVASDESVRALVQGPFPRFLCDNERYVAELSTNPLLRKQLEAQTVAAMRYVEVRRGEVLVFHSTRPSMVAARLRLVPGAFEIERDDEAVCLSVMQGGTPHSLRYRYADAVAVFEQHSLVVVDSAPQLRATVDIYLQRQSDSIAAEQANRLREACTLLCDVLDGCPCTALVLTFEAAAAAERFEAALRRQAAAETLESAPTTSVARPEDVATEEREQKWFALRWECPQIMWTVEDLPFDELTFSFGDGVVIEYNVTRFGKTISLEAGSLMMQSKEKGEPLLKVDREDSSQNTPRCKTMQSATNAVVRFVFRSSVDPGSANAMSFHVNAGLHMVLCKGMVSAIELTWDLISILLMKHLSWTVHPAIPWNTAVTFVETPATVSFGFTVSDHVVIDMLYDDDAATPCMKIEGDELTLDWEAGYALNTTKLLLQNPKLVATFPGVSAVHAAMIIPQSPPNLTFLSCRPDLLFSYTILYKPPGMSDAQWQRSSNPCGFKFTHFLEMRLRALTIDYVQTALWTVLEYFTSGHMTRLGYVGWRPRFTPETVPERWPLKETPSPIYGFLLLHQNIEILDCYALLPESSKGNTFIAGHCPRMSMHSELICEGSASDSAGVAAYGDVRSGLTMQFDEMTIYCLAPDEPKAAQHARSPLKLPDGRVVVANGLSLSFNIWFEAAGILKKFSEKTLELLFDDLLIHGTTSHLVHVLNWVCGCFQEPWKPFYPAKVYPKKPFSVLALDKESAVFYDWHIYAQRGLFHLAAPGTDQEIVMDLYGLLIDLAWKTDGGFVSRYAVASAVAWDLANAKDDEDELLTAAKSAGLSGAPPLLAASGSNASFRRPPSRRLTIRGTLPRPGCGSSHGSPTSGDTSPGGTVTLPPLLKYFISDVKEVAVSRQKFFRIAPRPHPDQPQPIDITYGWTGGDAKLVYGDYHIASIEIDLLHHGLFSLRDTLLSLPVRNAFAPMLRWPTYVPNTQRPAWDRKTQQWQVRHRVNCRAIVLTMFSDPHDWMSEPLLRATLDELVLTKTSDVCAENDLLQLSLRNVSCGLCGHNRSLTPLVKPQTHHPEVFTLEYSANHGLKGALQYLWILPPSDGPRLRQLYKGLTSPALGTLGTLGQYAEERGTPPPPPPPDSSIDDRSSDVDFLFVTPCLIVTEYDNKSKGIMINMGELVIRSKHVEHSPPGVVGLSGPSQGAGSSSPLGEKEDVDREFVLSVSKANITSLHHVGQMLLSPVSATIRGCRRSNGLTEADVKIEALLINVDQEYYESALYAAVRLLARDDTDLVDAKRGATAARHATASGGPPPTAVSPTHQPSVLSPASPSTKTDDLTDSSLVSPTEAELGGTLRTIEALEMAFSSNSSNEERRILLKAHAAERAKAARSVRTKLSLRWEKFRLRVHGDKVAVVASTGLMACDYDATEQTSTLKASIAKVEIGVEGRKMLVTIADKKESLSLTMAANATDNSKEAFAGLGTMSVYLDQQTLTPAVLFLYEPYRRIVVPHYTLSEVMAISDDTVLSTRLVLSSRRILQASSSQYNHITIDCDGNEVHFVESTTPILLIDSGLTVRFINGRLFLYDNPIEHYVQAGNGGLVVVSEEENAIIRTDLEAAVTSWATEQLPDSSLALTVRSGLEIVLPEASPADLPPDAGSLQTTRALVFTVLCSAQYNMKVQHGVGVEQGSVSLHRLQADCMYYQSGVMQGDDEAAGTVDFSNIISRWSMFVQLEGNTGTLPGGGGTQLNRFIQFVSKDEVQIRIRHGDVALAMMALQTAKLALSDVEENVMKRVPVKDADDLTNRRAQGETGNKDTTAFSVAIPCVGVTIVDDSRGDVDLPFVFLQVTHLSTPKCVLTEAYLALHANLTIQVDYYHVEAGAWLPLMDPAETDIVLKHVYNLTLEDLHRRKGDLRAGFRIQRNPLVFHVTPMAARALMHVSTLLSSLTSTANTAAAALAGPSTGARSFFSYSVEQCVAPVLQVAFPLMRADRGSTLLWEDFAGAALMDERPQMQSLQGGMSSQPLDLPNGNQVHFNFPRVGGRELPIHMHQLIVTHNAEETTIAVGKVGVFALPANLGLSSAIYEVQLVDGKKRILMRSNVSIENKLPFPVRLDGVNTTLSAGATFSMPSLMMQRRCVLRPLPPPPTASTATKKAAAAGSTTTGVWQHCNSASLGIHFESLPFLHDQVYLCECPTASAEEAQAQFATYFLVRFGPRTLLSQKPFMLDCRATFEAPFTIVNNTGAPIQVALYYKRTDNSKSRILRFGQTFYFHPVASLDIAADSSLPITQVDPEAPVYMDVTVQQPTGITLARVGGSGNSQPALIRAPANRGRDDHLTLFDGDSHALELRLEYNDRTVTLSCPFWIINQTASYLQFTDRTPRGTPVLCAGQSVDGLVPNSNPFLLCTDRLFHNKQNKDHIYVRIGRYGSNGAITWTAWSDKLFVDTIGSMFVGMCESPGNETYTFSYSVDIVGGALKDTKVIKFTPRWIVINRCGRPLSIDQNTVRPSHVQTLPLRHSTTIDTARTDIDNTLSIKYCDDEDLTSCQWSECFCIDRFAEFALNMCYKPKSDTSKFEFSVLRVSCYTRDSILYVAVDKSEKPPYVIENRTKYVVSVKQRGTERELIVYGRTTKGFVWENAKADPVIHLGVWEAKKQRTATYCVMNLAPEFVMKARYTLAQELVLPGGVVVYVRARALHASYSISVTTDSTIDRVRTRPYNQFSFKLHLQAINVLLGTTGSKKDDIALLSVGLPNGTPALTAVVSQGRGTSDEDEQTLDIKIGAIQVDDERPNAFKGVVLQIPSFDVVGTRRMDRSTPLVQVVRCEISMRPVTVHLEDTFLFEVIKLLERINLVMGKTQGPSISTFENAPWVHELESSKVVDESSVLWRGVFVEKLFIEQILISMSLYRGRDASRDPLRDQLGWLSIMIRSVQDARFDWRRIENSNLSDKLWLLLTFLRNYYMIELQQQLLNVVHVAGLDSMRNIVTDLLEGYFSASTGPHIDRTQQLVRRRQDLRFAPALEETQKETSFDVVDDLDATDNVPDCRCRWIEKQKRRGGFSRSIVSLAEFAHHTTWEQFVSGVTPEELRDSGVLAICQAIRGRPLDVLPRRSLCRRCELIDSMRTERMENDAMAPIPHPSSGQVEWCEFTHHVSWAEFTAICTLAEIQRFATVVKDSLLGEPYNVKRLDGPLDWVIREPQDS